MQIGSKQWKNLVDRGAKDLEIHIDGEKIDQFGIYAIELLKWNQKINLTAITDPLEVAVKHFLDSMAPVPIIPSDASLLDIGSGGGFPGIPLKICIPPLSVTLIDSSRKKISFLKHVIRTLGLHNIVASHIRAEDIPKEAALPNTYDVIISRALSFTGTFIHKALPLLSKDGIMITMKGKMTNEEVESVHSLTKNQFSLVLKKYRLPHLKSERSLLILKCTR